MPEETNNNAQVRQQKIEKFLLDPDKAIFENITEFEAAVTRLVQILSVVDIESLEQLQGKDGYTPVRGKDYFTEEDIAGIEAFILTKVPKAGTDFPTPAQVREFVADAVAQIPRVKGDKGDDGRDGKDGKDGSPDTGLDIVKKLRALGKNQMLKISDIRGLENALRFLVSADDFEELKKRVDNQKVVIPTNVGGEGSGNDATAIHSDGVDEFADIVEDDSPAGGDYILAERASDGAKIKIPFSAIGDGADGRTVLNGTGAPDNGDGLDGDFYIDTATWDIYGPKAAGAWPAGESLVGPQGPSGAGTGDMLAATYDPNGVEDDAFDMENMTEGATKKILTPAERTKLGHISITQAVDLDAVESNANAAKSKTDFISVTQAVDLDTIETQAAAGAAAKVKTDFLTVTGATDLDAIRTRVNDLDAAVVLRGGWDASAGTFPGGGAAQAGATYIVTVAGTVNGVDFAVNDRILAIVDNALTNTYANNWLKLDYTDQVLSVAGATGNVSAATIKAALALTAGDVGLGNVTNDAQLKAAFSGYTDKATPVDADLLTINDSAAANAVKKLTWANLKATLKTYFDTLYQPLNATLTSWAAKAVPAGTVVGTSDTQTLTGKRITPRIGTTASSATPTPDADSHDQYNVTALAAGATFGAPTGTPTDGQRLILRVKDNGTARTLAFNAIYRAVGVTLPTTTVISKTIYLGCIYNAADTKWDVIAYALEA